MTANEFRKLLRQKGACTQAYKQFEKDRRSWHLSVEKTLQRWIDQARKTRDATDKVTGWLCLPYDINRVLGEPLEDALAIVDRATPEAILELLSKSKDDDFREKAGEYANLKYEVYS